ncbi:hypothetical protein KIL84_005624 [Mauremys mutica]|uniref:Uncharacterized protein n=1 Tax=Mauremys mutica TaxID=74926 RepID=A0A9D3XDF1_9SAUR|nr:hypothetical protein KIL84_005624 [Mauremys mutica]
MESLASEPLFLTMAFSASPKELEPLLKDFSPLGMMHPADVLQQHRMAVSKQISIYEPTGIQYFRVLRLEWKSHVYVHVLVGRTSCLCSPVHPGFHFSTTALPR